MESAPDQPPFWLSLLPLLFISVFLAAIVVWLAPKKGKSPLLALLVFIPCGGFLVIIYLLSFTDKKVLDDIADLKSRIDRP